ncbi:MAG: amino acid permease [Gemmatimonadaceae bacterium]|nr:amino acid permease [Gemmatimonadaceae bacterium]MDQ3242762.1 amino acid permease [Gemmatimonadota bacterium]
MTAAAERADPHSSGTSPASSTEGPLPRRIGLWTAVAILVGTTIGSGIFRSPASIADKLPGPLPLLGVWVVGGIFALCGALTLAEASSAFPQTGGVYIYIREAWGRLAAFLFGWAELVLIRAAALGGISTTFAEYFIRVTGRDPGVAPFDAYVHYVAAAAILLTAAFNYVGVRTAGLVQNVTTLAKVGGLLFIILLAFGLGLPSTGGHYTPAAPPGSFSIAAFGLALVSVMWVYDGWADVSFVGGEVENPRRNLPRALIIGTCAIIVIYMLANLAYLAVLPVSEMRTSKLVAADVAERILGAGGVAFVATVVMISTLGGLNGSMFTGPRILFAMADDRLLFRSMAKVHPRYKTPYVSIWVVAILAAVFVLAGTFEQLVDAFVTAIVPFYALAVGSVFVLRGRSDYNPSFRVPGYPVVPALFIVSTLFLLGNAIVDPSSRWPTVAVLVVVLAGIPVYYMSVGRAKVSS